MPTFIGLDLAWTAHRDDFPQESGICVLEGEQGSDLRCSRVEAARYHISDLAQQLSSFEGPVFVAIDAPLIVTESRSADREVSKVFSYPYYAGPYTVTPAWLDQGDTWAGPRLGALLEGLGFDLDPSSLQHGERSGPMAIEVYPHPIHVSLFGLSRRIPYKKGSVAKKRRGLSAYQSHLEAYFRQHAPGVLENLKVRKALDPATLEGLKGTSRKGVPTLKHYEDTLDGLTCALYAWFAWLHPQDWRIYGDLNGYIVAPHDPNEPASLL